MATAKKAPAKKAPAKKAPPPAKSTASKKAAPAKKVAPAKKASPPKPAAGKKAAAPLKKAPPAAAKKKAPAPAKKAAPAKQKTAAPVKQAAPAKQAAQAPAKKVAPAKAAAKQAPPAPVKKAPPAPAKKAAPAKKSGFTPVVIEIPPVKGVTKEGVAYTKDFDVKFLTAQRALLLEEKAALTGQAVRLEDEANSLIEEQEMGDVQFDDEGGEGDTMVVERERDLTLSAQARQTIADIDTALARLMTGHYGYSTESGRPIPRERLEAIPWATMLVEEKVGGIGRR
jgi:RNA polymerase-binding transcription factor DksA